ncbi:MAG TPA: CopG family transcriptional regulator [Thermoplasmata archaeon]|nr:CopG family transcriptional regulator [Thermoplasmata archaeon]
MTGENEASNGMRTVQLPEELVEAISQRVRGTSFDSVDAFIAFVLARLLDQPGTSGFSEEEERSLRERLRSLGYID